MSRGFKLVFAQLNPLVGDVEGNAECIIQRAFEARDRYRADLFVAAELALTGYPPEDLLFRPSLLERVEDALADMQARVHGIGVILGLPMRTAGRLYNAAVYLRDGALCAHYYKQILPNYNVFDEKRYFSAGGEPCVIDIGGIGVGVTICEDAWQPEPTRQAAAAGAELIVNINASPFDAGKFEQRLEILHARNRETGLPIVYVNQVGGQDELVFDGQSLLMDAAGSVTWRAPAFTEGLFAAHFDAATGRWTPGALSTESLSEAATIYQALVLGVRDYVAKNGFAGALVGLSGGIDSALTLAIAVDALGAEAVEAVLMPSRYTADISLADAREECARLGVVCHEVPIEGPFEAFQAALATRFAGLPADTTEENIQARIRGTLLMAVSNKTGRMLLTTGNKSEMAVGYATLYGDMAGGYAPLKDVYKTRVYRLARHRNQAGEVIPLRVIERPPSAELAPDQKDEDSLPPYAALDPILAMFIEQDCGVGEIVARGYEPATVERVIALVLNNEYKRRQAPPGVKITGRAFGKDRRFPITSGYLSGLLK